jgi:hypothetical protein
MSQRYREGRHYRHRSAAEASGEDRSHKLDGAASDRCGSMGARDLATGDTPVLLAIGGVGNGVRVAAEVLATIEHRTVNP